MNLGKLKIDEGRLISRNMAVVGATDSGKSYAVKKLLPTSTLDTIVFDIESEYPYPKKRVALRNAREAAWAGKHYATHSGSAVIDFKENRLSEIPRLAAAFLGSLYENKTDRGRGVLIVVDEAYFYAPEVSVPSMEGVDTDASESMLFTIQARGRHRGLGTIIVTQRPQYVRKSVLAQCQYWLVFRLHTPPELRWAREHGFEKDTVKEIANLPQGTCYAYGFNGPQRIEVPA